MKRIMVANCMQCPYRTYAKKKVTNNMKIHYYGQPECGLDGFPVNKRVKTFPKKCSLLDA